MNTQIKKTKEDKKIHAKFALGLIVSGFVGGCISVAASLLNFYTQGLDAKAIYEWAFPISVYFAIAVSVLLILAALISLHKSTKIVRSITEEEEDTISIVESRLFFPLTAAGLFNIFILFMFGLHFFFAFEAEMFGTPYYLLSFLNFIVSNVFILYIQNKTIRLEKVLNPEKQGNIFSLNFRKTWESSLDEAERLQHAQAAYKAYVAGTLTAIGLWLLCVIAIITFHTGVLALICVCTLWAVMTATYCAYAAKPYRIRN